MSEAALIPSAGTVARPPIAVAPAPPASFVNRIINADCLDVLPELPGRSIDFAFTDPPYLTRYCDRSGRTVRNDDRNSWLRPAFAQIYRVLKDDRFCVSFCGWSKVDQFFAAWRAAGFYPVAHLVWAKRYASRQRYVAYHHEQAYVLAKGRPERPSIRLPDVLTWQYTENRLHPTQKPVGSMVPVVSTFSRPGDTVLDPFCGSGSMLVVAQSLGRRYIGIEIDAAYAEAAKARL
jgi:site-specific DNA-methyltransferase (adenine-specific)